MYDVYVDNKLLFSTGLEDDEHVILSPKVSLDINGAGSMTFTMPPGHVLYDAIQKLKSIITVKQDGKIIFRGRVMDDTKDFYNQKNVYCEGDRSFLLDSLHKPYSYSGNVQDFFRNLVSSHNGQVEAAKQFTVGTITAVSASLTMEAEDDDYADTASRMEDRLLSAYGGWLRTRTEGNTTYLDWLTKDGSADGQTIEFSVNLLDLEDTNDASNVFTVLIPLGASEIDDDGEYSDPLTIASVNNGCEYIQDDARVALYGKIWRTQTWAHEEDPAELLKKGREYLKTGIATQTLKLQFVDMHFTDSSKKIVLPGDHPNIQSYPHGLDIHPICAMADIDLLNPDKSTYTFGEAPKTLTDNYIQTEEDLSELTGIKRSGGGGGGGKGVQEELEAKARWLDVLIDQTNARLEVVAWDYNVMSGKITDLSFEIDAVEGVIESEIKETITDIDGRVTNAESSITQHADQIELKVSKDGVISAINQTAESITISASRVNLNGYVTASQLEAEIAKIKITDSSYITTAGLSTQSMSANYVDTNTLAVGGTQARWKEMTVVTDTSLSKSYSTVPGANGADYVVIGGVSLSEDKETIYYLGHS